MLLRPYQLECIEKSLQALARGVRKQLVSLPVGSGKTVVFTSLIRQVPPPSNDATKTLVLAHREELIMQAYRTIKKLSPDMIVGVDQGSGKNADVSGCEVIVASVPTLSRRESKRLSKYDPSLFKCLIIDEVLNLFGEDRLLKLKAHHAAAESYSKIIDYFGVDREDSPILLWGCSATALRHDRKMLGSIFQEIVYHQSMVSMIEEKWLCNVKVHHVETTVQISKVAIGQDGDYKIKQLSRAINIPERNRFIVKEWEKIRAKENVSSTLVFAVDIEHVMHLKEEFVKSGIMAEAITSKTRRVERRDILERFQRKEVPVLVNCGILTEGTDIPCIDCLVMARPTRSTTLLTQMVGRGMRLHPEKEVCVMLDFVDNSKNINPAFQPSLEGLDIKSLKEANEESIASEELKPDDSALQEETEGDFLAGFNKEEHIITNIIRNQWLLFAGDNPETMKPPLEKSVFAWIRTTNDRYLLNLLDNSILEIIPPSDKDSEYLVRRRKRLKNNVWIKQKLPIKARTLETAVKAADTWALSDASYPKNLFFFAKWRSSPATESQLNMVKKLGGGKYLTKAKAKALTKGMVCDILTILMTRKV